MENSKAANDITRTYHESTASSTNASMEMKKHMDAEISQKTVKRQTGKRKQR